MKKNISTKRRLSIASDRKTHSELYSIVLRGVTSTLESILNDYYVSDNIDGLLKYINNKRIIEAEEYKRLLSEAKDFYPVIICAIVIQSLRKHTNSFRYKELDGESKKLLFAELKRELTEFFIDWLCVIDTNPLLLYRVAAGYNISFNLQLHITKQINHILTEIEESILKAQIVEIITVYLIEQVAIHLGLVGLDYLDYFNDNQLSGSNKPLKKDLECTNQKTIFEAL
jgi:hypothetical protein